MWRCTVIGKPLAHVKYFRFNSLLHLLHYVSCLMSLGLTQYTILHSLLHFVSHLPGLGHCCVVCIHLSTAWSWRRLLMCTKSSSIAFSNFYYPNPNPFNFSSFSLFFSVIWQRTLYSTYVWRLSYGLSAKDPWHGLWLY